MSADFNIETKVIGKLRIVAGLKDKIALVSDIYGNIFCMNKILLIEFCGWMKVYFTTNKLRFK